MKSLRDALLEMREELLDSKALDGSKKIIPSSLEVRPTMNIYEEVKPESPTEFYKFKLYVKDDNLNEHSVGIAYMREGLNYFTLKFWTFLDQRFYLLPRRDDPTKYLLMSREMNRSSNRKNKFFWHQIGNAKADSKQCLLEIQFELFPRQIFLNLYPENPSLIRRR